MHVVSSLYRVANQKAAEEQVNSVEKTEDQVKYISLSKQIDEKTIADLNKLLPSFSYNKVSYKSASI